MEQPDENKTPEAPSLQMLFKNPHIIATVLVAVSVVLASIVYTTQNHTAQGDASDTTQPRTTSDVGEAAPALPEKDENNNGTPDWQEVTLRDLEAPRVSQNTQTDEVLKKQYTKTELLAGDLFGGYLARVEANSYNEQTGNEIVANALLGLDIQRIPQITKDSLTISSGNVPTSARAYKEAMSPIVTSLEAIPEYELITYARATEQNSAAEFAKISAAADVYATSVEQMKRVLVPTAAVDAHLALINSFTKVSLALLEMSRGYDDVAGSYAALKTFGEAEKEIDYAFTLQRTYLALHNAL